jgi:hypothetical protein
VKRADTRPSATGRRARPLAVAGLVVALGGGLTACSALSPQTVLTPYAPADGVNVDLSDDVLLRDFLVVAAEKGGRGAVVGTIVNDGERTAVVELAAQLAESAPFGQTRVSVPPSGRVAVGPGQRNQMTIDDMPVAPGETIQMSAAVANAGARFFPAPVLRPEVQYASITPAPTTPSALPTGSPSASASSGAEPTESATEEPTGTP